MGGKLRKRMPVIIERKDYDAWLNPAFAPDRVMGLLHPFPAERMTQWRVGTLVNNPRNESKECIRKV